jgi:hypothetical protein
LSGDYYEAENTLVRDYLKANPDWKISDKPLHTEVCVLTSATCSANTCVPLYASSTCKLRSFQVVMVQTKNNTEVTVIFDKHAEDYDSAMKDEEGQEEEQQAEEEQAPGLMLPFSVVLSKGDKVAPFISPLVDARVFVFFITLSPA